MDIDGGLGYYIKVFQVTFEIPTNLPHSVHVPSECLDELQWRIILIA